MSMPLRRLQQAIWELGGSASRQQGSGGGSGFTVSPSNYAAAGNQGNYATANSATYTDITNSSFTLIVPRTQTILYMVYAACNLTAAGAVGYVRGNIVGYDTSASLQFGTTGVTNGFIWYMALASGKGPLLPGTYTVKLQAATDNNTFSITVDQLFHQIVFLS